MWIDELKLLHAYCGDRPPGRVLVDVGAYHGGHLPAFLNADWSVLAIEPDPAKQAALQALAQRYPKCSVAAVAAGETTVDNVPFYTSKVSDGVAGLTPFHETHTATAVVKVVALRELLPSFGIQRVDLLKIDAEGGDLSVLKGLDWTQIRPSVVMCEFDEAKAGCPSLAALLSFLAGKGMESVVSEWHPILKYGAEHAWNSLRMPGEALENASAWGNILAFSDGLDERRLVKALTKTWAESGSRYRTRIRSLERDVDNLRRVETGLLDDLHHLRNNRVHRWSEHLRRLLGKS